MLLYIILLYPSNVIQPAVEVPVEFPSYAVLCTEKRGKFIIHVLTGSTSVAGAAVSKAPSSLALLGTVAEMLCVTKQPPLAPDDWLSCLLLASLAMHLQLIVWNIIVTPVTAWISLTSF